MNNNEVRISTETVPATSRTVAEVIINGSSKGKRTINGGPSLKEFATSLATEFGIKSFTITVDDVPVTAASASTPVPDNSTVRVNAKDSRGLAPASLAQADGADAGDESDDSATQGDVTEEKEEEETAAVQV